MKKDSFVCLCVCLRTGSTPGGTLQEGPDSCWQKPLVEQRITGITCRYSRLLMLMLLLLLLPLMMLLVFLLPLAHRQHCPTITSGCSATGANSRLMVVAVVVVVIVGVVVVDIALVLDLWPEHDTG